MGFFDFISEAGFCTLLGIHRRRAAHHARGPDGVCSGNGRVAEVRVGQVRQALPRRFSCALDALLRAVPHHGLRSTDLPGEPARHSDVSAGLGAEALSQRDPLPGGAQHLGRRQRETGLADLRRFRTRLDRPGHRVVRQRGHWHQAAGSGLRTGLDHHRSVPVAVPLGEVPTHQGGRQVAHPSRPARKLPDRDNPYVWQGSRRKHPRRADLRCWLLLHHGSGVSGLQPVAPHRRGLRVLRHAGQEELPSAAALLAPHCRCRQTRWRAIRPDRCSDGILLASAIPRCTASDRIPRPDHRQEPCVPDQQLPCSCADQRRLTVSRKPL
jgi:hypothetical protein